TDVMQMLRLGVMSTPSILIDDKPVAVGRVPSREEIDEWLRQE
ncbi:MAG: thioredoxin family protein, partial [Sutterella wadsworthensis]|nr:thioredoxin family protein [Sutterella wadsworthensis]